MKQYVENIKSYIQNIGQFAIERCGPEEQMGLEFKGESSSFIRFNRSKVRQVTHVEQCHLSITFLQGGRTSHYNLSITFDEVSDRAKIQSAISSLKKETKLLPEDPHQVLFENSSVSENVNQGQLKNVDELMDLVLKPLGELDVAGYVSNGPIYRASINSEGQNHFYYGENFFVDFSLFDSKQNAVKGFYGGNEWNQTKYLEEVNRCKEFLAKMSMEKKDVPRGKYRAYFAPAAVNDFVSMFGWHGISLKAIKHNRSAFCKIYNNERQLSPKFNFSENFALGLGPQFNSRGEVSDEKIELIKDGKLENVLVSSRSSKEFGEKTNGADTHESPRSPYVAAGKLKEEDILKEIGTGLYISNIHYLNWSDVLSGRLTGMTRYACFWVENGEIVGPIKDLRFDESFYNFFGDQLVDLTEETETFPNISTYGQRSVGGACVPGILVNNFTFTL
ncbi:MAG: TldD/PmbA family protein [Bacteriovoracaceae bacterium]